MKVFIAIVAIFAVALAKPFDEPEPLPFELKQTSDVDGSYSYTYASEDASKVETRYPDGSIVGGYQYIDSEGVLQKVQYQAGVDGVQIVASNLPVGSTDPVQDTPEVLQATEEHFHEIQKSLQLIARAAALEAEYKRLHPDQE